MKFEALENADVVWFLRGHDHTVLMKSPSQTGAQSSWGNGEVYWDDY